MTRQWQAGDVAIATYSGEPNVRVSRYGHGWARLTDPDDFINDGEAMGTYIVTDARPLVVIDPEDREQVERLAAVYRDLTGECELTDEPWSIPGLRMQAALRELADPAPPKPDEPTDPAARVIDRDGNVWASHEGNWWRLGPLCLLPRTWSELLDCGPLEVRA